MRVTFCDICREEVGPTDERNFEMENGQGTTLRMDLCPDCVKKIINFIKNI